MDQQLVNAAVAAIGQAYGQKVADISMEQIKGWFDKATKAVGEAVAPTTKDLERLKADVFDRGAPIVDAEINRRNLARWLEIPLEEYDATPKEQLEPDVLIRHIYLERLFGTWLEEWGYKVQIGEDLEGKEGVDFTPDVYGQLVTVHGEFELCISFVCDSPPSMYRVRALMETVEAYSAERPEFTWGDVYILATPFQFGRSATASIRLQSEEERYTVVKLEAEDIHGLQNASDKKARLSLLMQHVERARTEGPQR